MDLIEMQCYVTLLEFIRVRSEKLQLYWNQDKSNWKYQKIRGLYEHAGNACHQCLNIIQNTLIENIGCLLQITRMAQDILNLNHIVLLIGFIGQSLPRGDFLVPNINLTISNIVFFLRFPMKTQDGEISPSQNPTVQKPKVTTYDWC